MNHRVPGAIGVVIGLLMGLFGIAWTIGALQMGAPWFFGVFGVVFTVLAGGVPILAGLGVSRAVDAHQERKADIDPESGPAMTTCEWCGRSRRVDASECPGCGQTSRES